MWWVYKCNSRQPDYARDWGDWNQLFEGNGVKHWGTTELIPELEKAHRGDMIIALQTNRNELVGVAKVTRQTKRRGFLDLMLKPVESIGVKVRPLKKSNPRIGSIPALQSGRIATLYPISPEDADKLLRAAGAATHVDAQAAAKQAIAAQHGAGFGTPEQNRRVEQAAVDHVTRKMREMGWQVQNVSSQKLGYDLVCRKGRECRHVEAKGSRGTDRQFIITANEKCTWSTDPSYALALVTNALKSTRAILWFNGKRGHRQFRFLPISFVAIAV